MKLQLLILHFRFFFKKCLVRTFADLFTFDTALEDAFPALSVPFNFIVLWVQFNLEELKNVRCQHLLPYAFRRNQNAAKKKTRDLFHVL